MPFIFAVNMPVYRITHLDAHVLGKLAADADRSRNKLCYLVVHVDKVIKPLFLYDRDDFLFLLRGGCVLYLGYLDRISHDKFSGKTIR